MAGERTLVLGQDEARGEFFGLVEGDRELGYMTLRRVHDEGIIIDHTIVHPEAEGQGVGSALFALVVAWIEARGLYLVPVCPFVFGRLNKRPELADSRAVPRGPLPEG